ncbi:MAG: NAD-dependent epimerase/dehydratase family protein, partial [Planctomycetota bacterium]
MTAAAAAASTSVFVGAANAFADEVTKADKPLEILILGGTGFLGPHQVRQAVDAGHTVTLANRGKTRPE